MTRSIFVVDLVVDNLTLSERDQSFPEHRVDRGEQPHQAHAVF